MLEDDEFEALIDSISKHQVNQTLLSKASAECAETSTAMQNIVAAAAKAIERLSEKHPNAFKLMQPAIILHYSDQSTRALNPHDHAGASTEIVFGHPTRCKQALLEMSKEVLAQDGNRS